jgi:hypothetical protein
MAIKAELITSVQLLCFMPSYIAITVWLVVMTYCNRNMLMKSACIVLVAVCILLMHRSYRHVTYVQKNQSIDSCYNSVLYSATCDTAQLIDCSLLHSAA